jgi:hypothetical protein
LPPPLDVEPAPPPVALALDPPPLDVEPAPPPDPVAPPALVAPVATEPPPPTDEVPGRVEDASLQANATKKEPIATANENPDNHFIQDASRA